MSQNQSNTVTPEILKEISEIQEEINELKILKDKIESKEKKKTASKTAKKKTASKTAKKKTARSR